MVNRPFLAAIAGLGVIGGTVVGVYLAVSPGGEEEVVQVAATPTADASPGPTETGLTEEEIGRLFAEDIAKPRAQGRVGPFLVTSGDWWAVPSCEEFHEPVGDFEQSEMYFGVPIDEANQTEDESVRRCPDGTILGAVSRPVSRSYFVGDPKVSLSFAPAERVKLTSVSGLPAIVAEPFPYLVSPAALIVLERPPAAGRPGLLLHIDGSNVDAMTALAEQVIAASSR